MCSIQCLILWPSQFFFISLLEEFFIYLLLPFSNGIVPLSDPLSRLFQLLLFILPPDAAFEKCDSLWGVPQLVGIFNYIFWCHFSSLLPVSFVLAALVSCFSVRNAANSDEDACPIFPVTGVVLRVARCPLED